MLDQPDEIIWAKTEKIVRADPTFMPVEAWSQKIFSKSI